MGLASALSTALTGLTASETTIDVVGNNLANSNTVGFKASTASFSTQFLQTLALGSQPSSVNGGTNPRQVGLGTMVSDITPNFNQGTLEISSNPTDLAIQGDGFFMVEGGQGDTFYTRNGIFKFNSQNEMVTITGNRLMGFGIDDQFQIERTTLTPITIPLGAAAVAQPTSNVFLEGTLSPTGDLATQARRIQTPVLGDGTFTAPSDSGDVSNALQPSVVTITTANNPGASGFVAGDTYEYKLVWGDDYGLGTTTPVESRPSDTITATVGANNDDVVLNGLPTSPPSDSYTHLRVYRKHPSDPTSEFSYVGQVDPTMTTTFTDTGLPDGDELEETLISGNYSYYMTFVTDDGRESRPGPIAGPINVTNSRVTLNELPVADTTTTDWRSRRIYRNLSTDSSSFYLAGEILNMDAGVMFVDNRPDADIINPDNLIDLEGPTIQYETLLTDVISRDGSVYSNVFVEGTLQFTGKKGGRSLEMQEFEITSTTTVQDLINFMDDGMGIQSAAADPVNPIPQSETGTVSVSPGGLISSDGRIVLTGNNGVDNAIDIGLSGMLIDTGTSIENVNVPWGVLQEAQGESAVTDFLVYDTLGIPLRVRITCVMEERDSTSTTYRWFADSPDNDPSTGSEIAVGTGRITFDGEGNLLGVSEATVSIDRRNVSSASPLEFEIDFSSISGLAADQSNVAVSRQDGSGPGVLTSFIVGEDGVIRGVFSNGITRDLGQIRLARFSNPSGLEQKGENLYAEGVNSGLPIEGDPGNQGIGGIISGAVELSNTDIGSNLIDLILASTMYRGNTRVITTAQQMIDELLSLRR